MNAITYTSAKKHLAETIERVCEEHLPVIIQRKNKQAVVMISLEDYQAIEETSYLLQSPKNAKRLLESVKELERGYGTERELIE